MIIVDDNILLFTWRILFNSILFNSIDDEKQIQNDFMRSQIVEIDYRCVIYRSPDK